MASKASKLICVDDEVFEILRDKAKKTGITSNNIIREMLKLPKKNFKVGRPPKEVKD